MKALVRPLNGWDAVKLVALLLMLIDHSGLFFFPDERWLRAFGRGAAPIFLFLGGFAASYRFKLELLAIAVALQVAEIWLDGHMVALNILFSIIVCRAIFDWLERHGRVIRRPMEWFIICLFWLPSMFVIQYGSLSLLLGICGAMKKYPERYSVRVNRRFWLFTFLTYWLVESYWSGFSPINSLWAGLTLSAVYMLLRRFTLEPVQAPWCSGWIKTLGKLASYYSGYIYAIHLAILGWLTGISL